MSAPSLTLRRFPDSAQMCAAAARQWVELAAAAIAESGRFTVALSGGSTPKGLYELLAAAPFGEKVEWGRVEFFWGDERAVAPDRPESNFYMAERSLLEKLELRPEQIHRIRAEENDRGAAAEAYEAEIARVFGVSAGGKPPSLDLVLLGLGVDGHTASLFPYSEILHERARWVAAHYVSKLGADRITLTPTIINGAAHVIFLVAGAEKAAALAEVLEGPEDPERLPAQLIRPISGQLMWFVDGAAAALLRRGIGDKGDAP